MKKLTLAALMVMALIAAPVLAQNDPIDPDTAVGAPPGKGSEAPPELQTPPTEPGPPPTEPGPPPTEPGPPPTEPGPPPDSGTLQDLPPQDPPPEVLPPPVPQEVVGDQKANGGDLEQETPNQEAIINALKQAAEKQESDGGEAERSVGARQAGRGDLDEEVGDLNDDDIANLRHRIRDLLNHDGKDEDEEENDGGSVRQKTEQEADSGDVDQSIDVSNTGDYVNQCVAVLQAANTGNAQNAPAFLQYSGDADDFEPGGIGITISPQLVQDCRQIIQQSTVVNQLINPGRPGAGPPGGGIPPGAVGGAFYGAGSGQGVLNAPGGLGQPGFGQPLSRIGQSGLQQLNGAPTGRMLPRTGGPGAVSLLTLSAGALLIAGGLLVRRIFR
jgi:hypothetical protein